MLKCERGQAELARAGAGLGARRKEEIEAAEKARRDEFRQDLAELQAEFQAKDGRLEEICALLETAPSFQPYSEGSLALEIFQQDCGLQSGGRLAARALIDGAFLIPERDANRALIPSETKVSDDGSSAWVYIRSG